MVTAFVFLYIHHKNNLIKKTTFTIRGTHCNACKALIEDVCNEVPGIISCKVDFKTGITEIEHGEHADWQKLKKEVESLGNYKVEIND